MSKTICIYHKNCFDGICAAWVVNKRFHGCELRAMNYGDEFPFNEYGSDDAIIIVDFSFPRDVMEAINKQCESLIVLDHHKTAQANCEGLDFCVFDMNESGASLAWKYFFPNKEVPNLVRYIKDRDLWKFKEHNSEIINSYIQSYPMEIGWYEKLYSDLETYEGKEIAYQVGSGINRYKKTMVQAICKNASINKQGIPIANTSLLFSEVGHELCKMYPEAPFAIYYYDRLLDGTRQFGLRSVGDFDVSEVARGFGGGGHKNAAGFQMNLAEVDMMFGNSKEMINNE